MSPSYPLSYVFTPCLFFRCSQPFPPFDLSLSLPLTRTSNLVLSGSVCFYFSFPALTLFLCYIFPLSLKLQPNKCLQEATAGYIDDDLTVLFDINYSTIGDSLDW